MKKILIYIHSFFPFEDSNTNVMMPIIENLKTDFQVDILCCNVNNCLPQEEYLNQMSIFRYANYKTNIVRLILWLRTFPIDYKKYSIYKYSVIKLARLLSILPYKILRNSEESRLRSLIQRGEYSVLITVTSPIQPQYIALRLAKNKIFEKKNVKWIPYFMDPFANYIGNENNRNHLIKFEEEIYKYSTFVFTSPEIYEDNKSSTLGDYIKKTVPIPLANLRKHEHSGQFSGFDLKKINCLYTGSLQDVRVRNPEYLFKLIKECSSDIHFHMIISTWSFEANQMREFYLKEANNVTWYDKLSLNESLVANDHADILINIGNRCTNQLPGKVLDFISSGKPIVNICNLVEDTSKKFLDKYPYKINIHEDNQKILENSGILQEFCKEYCGKHANYEIIEELYNEYTSKNVTNLFMQEVKSVI